MISGGLFGEAYRVTADNCRADVMIEGGDNTGGFVGLDGSSTYRNCKVTGKVTGLWSIGGFVGYAGEAESTIIALQKLLLLQVTGVPEDLRDTWRRESLHPVPHSVM